VPESDLLRRLIRGWGHQFLESSHDLHEGLVVLPHADLEVGQLRRNPLLATRSCWSFTKARTIQTLISTALGEFKMVAAMTAPCSVKA
jgi:hypothetical protein